MSIQWILTQISSIDRQMQNIEGQIHSVNESISRKQKEATGILDKIGKKKDLKRAINYLKIKRIL